MIRTDGTPTIAWADPEQIHTSSAPGKTATTNTSTSRPDPLVDELRRLLDRVVDLAKTLTDLEIEVEHVLAPNSPADRQVQS